MKTSVIAALLFLTSIGVGAQQTHLLVVVGLGGDETYRELFHEWATILIEAASSRYGLPRERITYLGEDLELGPAVIDDRSTRENIGSAIESLADDAQRGDHVMVVIFGHGSSSGAPRVNLPGRDLSVDDFSDLLARLDGRFVTFVNTASASGPFVETLSAADRVVVTATRTGRELNASVFGGYFVRAFDEGESEADQNKDRRISILEAFTYARQKVEQEYEADGKLLTEHALLDDNGDGEGTPQPDPLVGDGMFARTLFFSSGETTVAELAFPDDPELRRLYDERTALEERVEALQLLKGGTDAERYEQELETLLVELALKSRAIREIEELKRDSEVR